MKFIYRSFYHFLPIQKINNNNELFILNEQEIKVIRSKERMAIMLAAFFGVMGVLLLYVPQYIYPLFFPSYPVQIFKYSFNLPLTTIIYSTILVLIEVMLLTLLNIWCAHEIAVATGFIHEDNKRTSDKRNLLIDIGLEKKNKEILRYGIDPLQGINKKALMAWNLLFLLKATLSNMVFKILIQRLLGRYAIKAIQDFAGIPIFAAWNAHGTRVILREARVIIMGRNLIEQLAKRIKRDQKASPAFKLLLYDTLQYIAISKRDFHQNHFILTKTLFDLYHISPKDSHFLEKGYFEKLHAASRSEREVCQLLICIGFMLDGKLSVKEQVEIRHLHKNGLLDISADQMKQYAADFYNGKGVENLIRNFID